MEPGPPDPARGSAAVRIVVPCYNEERRLFFDRFAPLLERDGLALVFVDDGSGDRTLELLRGFVATRPRVATVISLSRNSGKAEAVRAGLLEALAAGADVVGYLDADLSTPPEELLRMLDVLERGGARVVLGSRVRLLGSRIDRHALRHYRGRIFATGASLALGLPVYDTQCGAKLFRAGPALSRALAAPFNARWAFDVELIGRLLAPAGGRELRVEDFVEVPLRRWSDVGGSKLGAWAMMRSALDLAGVAYRLRRARRRPR
jgi:dolichyl-phosphate beta-glucosyltransferase